ncbi:MAG TPA: YciI family protein [Pseudonocardiaceae bacterium]|nr:YciI family protein [Pseudonocardiaceae bacterium]
MKYLLMIVFNPQAWDGLTEEQHQEVFRGHGEFIAMLQESGELVRTDALADPAQSATVRIRDGVRLVTDGPFVEAKEYLAGYYLVDCDSRERAIELAAMIPDAAFSALEVRPLMSENGSDL